MLHFIHERPLQAEHIGGQRIIENLTPTVVQHLVSKGPASKYCVQIFALGAFAQKTRTGIDPQFVDLESLYEFKFFRRKFAQAWTLAQRALLARRKSGVRASVSKDHGKS